MSNSYEAATLFMLYSKGYEDGAKQVVGANDRISGSLKKVSNEATKAMDHVERLKKMQHEEMRLGNQQGFSGGGRASQFISQLGYGLEDFTVGYQLGGTQMAMRGVTNNLTMMAAAIGGIHGALAALGTVLVVAVLPALAKMASYTSAFAGMEKRTKDFLASVEDRKNKLQGKRKVEDTLADFDGSSTPEELINKLKAQQKVVQRAEEDVNAAIKDSEAIDKLWGDLHNENVSELQRKNLVQKSLSGTSAAIQSIFQGLIGSESGVYAANIEEISKMMSQASDKLSREMIRLAIIRDTEQEILQSMTQRGPEKFKSIVQDADDASTAAFNARMSQGNKLLAQYEAERKAILDNAMAMRERAESLVDENDDYGKNVKGVLERIDQMEQTQLQQLQQEHQKRSDEANSELESVIGGLEDSMLSPVDRAIKEITRQAEELRKRVEESLFSIEQKDYAFERIGNWEKFAKEKEMLPERTYSGTPLETIMAGSDKIFSSVQRQELETLKQIANNTNPNNATKMILVGGK